MKKNQKMNVIEIAVLVIMFFCYLVTLYFVVFAYSPIFIIMFFALHGVLAMTYFYLNHEYLDRAKLEEEEELEKQEKEITNRTLDYDKVKRENEELIKKNEMLEAGIENFKSEIDILLKKNVENQRENAELEKKNSILPDGENAINTDLLSVIHKICSTFEKECRKKRIRMEVAALQEKIWMICDSGYFQIILRNIIDNSLKYMNKRGSIVITVSDIGEDGIILICKDNGEGMEKEEVSRIFEMNYQGTNSTSGTGLGLAQVKAIVEHYHGTVYAKSERGKGMAVYIQFPYANKG